MLKSIFKSSSIGILGKVISASASFLLIPILISKIGVTEYGIWITITSSIGIISLLDFGISNHLMNLIAGNINNPIIVAKAITETYLSQLFSSVIFLLIFICLFNFLPWELVLNLPNNKYRTLILIIFSSFFITIISNTIYSIQRGFQKLNLANTWQLLSNIIVFIFQLLVLIFAPNLILFAIVTFLLPAIVSIINTLNFFWKHKFFNPIYFKFNNIKNSFLFVKGGLFFFYLQIVSFLAFQTDNLILAHLTDFPTVASFNIVAKIFTIPIIIFSVFAQNLWPSYTIKKSVNDWKWIKRTFLKSIILTSIFCIVFSMLIILFKNKIELYWLKNLSHIDYKLLFIFSIWNLVTCAFATNIGVLMNSLGLLRSQFKYSLLMLAINLIISIYLTKMIGITGVLWGSIISSFIFSCIPLFIIVYKHLNLKIQHENL